MLISRIFPAFFGLLWSENFSWRFPSSGGFRSKRRHWKVLSLWSTMPPKMNQVWKALQEKNVNKRTQQAIRPRQGAKGTAAPGDIIVQRLIAEPDNKQTFRPAQPREFVEFSSDDLTLENLKIACAEHFGYPLGSCDVLVSNKGPSCTNINQIPPPQRQGKLK